MKRHITLSLSLFLLSLPFLTLRAQINEKPFVIPELRQWEGKEGSLNINANTKITYRDKETQRIATQLSTEFVDLLGLKLEVTDKKANKGDIVLQVSKNKKLGKEGYTIKIDDKIEISSPTTQGVLWGTKTLLQMSEQSETQSVPKGTITDWPDYGIRGFMLDCGRKYIPIEFLRDYVKFMSYYKMNTFQIHLNDNAFKQYYDNNWDKTYSAFRLECETYPGLTARDGYYTKKEFIALQALADSLGVEIIPEIDAPAHSLAFTLYKPEIGSEEYGKDHLDLFKDETYTFMDNLFKEYLDGENPVFRGKRFHVGTDEYSNKDTAVVEKFRYFTDYCIKLAESYGKQACIWGALTHAKGETPVKVDNVLMYAWYNGYANPVDMIKLGYDLVSIPDGYLYIVPAAGYYYDYLNTENLYKNWTPAQIGKEKFEEKHPQIKGGMFAVWNDHSGNGISTKDIHYRVRPAMQTLAVKMWTGKEPKIEYEVFNKQREAISEAPGINIAGDYHTSSALRKNNPANKGFEKAKINGKESVMQIYHSNKLAQESKTGIREIGYSYSVTFDIDATKEEKGTTLFSSPETTFYLSDPASGLLGFSRDGYLNTFNYQLYPGEKANITISGDTKNSYLYVNGKLVETLDIQKLFFNEGKATKAYVRTLVFPLEKSGKFKSTITNLAVYNTSNIFE